MTPRAEPFDAVVVGGGPRGVALAERIAARNGDGERPVRLAVVDAVEVGAGATWRTDQSPLLLNNTYSAHTTIYPDASTPMTGPVVRGPDLMEWAAEAARGGARPEWARREAALLRPWSFPSRRIQGVYYREQLARAAATGRVAVTGVPGTAVDLADGSLPGTRAVRLAGGRVLEAPLVVLAQGMVQAVASDRVREMRRAAREHGLVYIEPGMPAERDWGRVPAGEEVLVAGLGANFFDVVALLTEGRGGRFAPAGDPAAPARLRYLPSGAEPVLVAGSRRGLPYRGKAAYPDGFPPRYEPRFADRDWFARVAATPLQDFRTAVWPRLAREFAWAHLGTLLAHRPGALVPGTTAERVAADLAGADAAGVDAVVSAAVADPRWSLSVGRLDRPAVRGPMTAAEWDACVAAHVDSELATIGAPLTDPRNAVNRAMAAVRGPVNALVTAGALDGRSVRDDVQGGFVPTGLALASGPPPERTAQVLALIDAGLLRLLGEGSAFSVRGGAFEGSAAAVPREPVRTRALIETRMSKGRVTDTDDPLLRALLDTGRARLYARPNTDGTHTSDGTLDVTPDGFHLVDAAGRPDEHVVVLGIPAEGVQPGSAIGATPGVPSPLLAGADRAAARILAARDAGHPRSLASP